MAGEILKKRREELGLGIKDVSSLLRIKAEYLSSIEEDQFEKLPVAVYTSGYIRCYAAYLHVDPEPILSGYSGHLSYPQPPAVLPVSSSMKKVPFYQYLIFLALLLLVGLTIFIATRQDDTDTPVKALSIPAQPMQVLLRPALHARADSDPGQAGKGGSGDIVPEGEKGGEESCKESGEEDSEEKEVTKIE